MDNEIKEFTREQIIKDIADNKKLISCQDVDIEYCRNNTDCHTCPAAEWYLIQNS